MIQTWAGEKKMAKSFSVGRYSQKEHRYHIGYGPNLDIFLGIRSQSDFSWTRSEDFPLKEKSRKRKFFIISKQNQPGLLRNK